jgi:hypothetical protein
VQLALIVQMRFCLSDPCVAFIAWIIFAHSLYWMFILS